MIRLSMVLLAAIGVTMSVAGRDLEPHEMAAQAGGMGADVARAETGDLVQPGRLALDDDAGALRAALAAVTIDPAAPPAEIIGGSDVAPVADAPATEAPAVEAPAASTPLWTVTARRVNVRSGPGTSNPVVDQVIQGDRVEVLDRTAGGWAQIRLPATGKQAFIFARFLSPAG